MLKSVGPIYTQPRRGKKLNRPLGNTKRSRFQQSTDREIRLQTVEIELPHVECVPSPQNDHDSVQIFHRFLRKATI